MIIIQNVLVAVGASFIDRFLGDPEFVPHPVRIFGKIISLADRWLNRGKAFWRLFMGFVFAVSLTGAVFGLTYFALEWVELFLPSWCYWSLLMFLANQCVSYADLKREAMQIYDHLKKNDIDFARERLKRIVGRDTDELASESVTAATIESVAEGTPDGIITPLIFMCLGGVPAALAMKAINTMDSMIGHRDEK